MDAVRSQVGPTLVQRCTAGRVQLRGTQARVRMQLARHEVLPRRRAGRHVSQQTSRVVAWQVAHRSQVGRCEARTVLANNLLESVRRQ
jgi:hypothetical protein